jgi:O-antigen/teichoic acid export membrane protein
MQDPDRAGTFAGRVVALFGTSVFAAGIGILNGILIARFLGPTGKGTYYLLTILPATAMVFLQLGLSQAFTFYAARGQTSGLVLKSLALTAVLSALGFAGVAVFFTVTQGSSFDGIPFELIAFAFLALPLALSATFTTGIVIGRQQIRLYSVVKMVTPIVTTVLLILILGVLGGSVTGAIVIYLIGTAVQAVGLLIGAVRAGHATPLAGSARYQDLLRYGLPTYVGSLTTFFNYRADVFMIAVLLANPAETLGYYSMAVGFAELVFFLPNAVSQLFLPQVAEATREDADAQVPMVARITLLITGAGALLLLPGAALMIPLVLPAFGPSLAPLAVLLPGVVALSVAKVVAGYVAGVGRPGVNSFVSIVTFAVNFAANLVLIPRFGIVGAAAASLVSYTGSALLITAIVARWTGTSLALYWIPRPSDVRITVETGKRLVRRMVTRVGPRPGVGDT